MYAATGSRLDPAAVGKAQRAAIRPPHSVPPGSRGRHVKVLKSKKSRRHQQPIKNLKAERHCLQLTRLISRVQESGEPIINRLQTVKMG